MEKLCSQGHVIGEIEEVCSRDGGRPVNIPEVEEVLEGEAPLGDAAPEEEIIEAPDQEPEAPVGESGELKEESNPFSEEAPIVE